VRSARTMGTAAMRPKMQRKSELILLWWWWLALVSVSLFAMPCIYRLLLG
jgi:hypothetical protein